MSQATMQALTVQEDTTRKDWMKWLLSQMNLIEFEKNDLISQVDLRVLSGTKLSVVNAYKTEKRRFCSVLDRTPDGFFVMSLFVVIRLRRQKEDPVEDFLWFEIDQEKGVEKGRYWASDVICNHCHERRKRRECQCREIPKEVVCY